MELMILFAVYLFFYFFSHSLLAATRVKKTLQNKGIISFRYYRLFFNLIAILLLIPVIVLYYLGDKQLVLNLGITGDIIGGFIIIIGIYLWKLIFKNYALSEFIGLDRLKLTNPVKQKLASGGLNKLVRHPLYSVSYLILMGLFLIFPNDFILIFIVLVSIYFPIGIYFEEKKLEKEFGQAYLEYKRNTPMLIPGI